MDWFVFGDLTFLGDIVNGVAMLMASVGGPGTNNYTGLVQLAMLLGVAVMLFGAAVRGGGLPWGQFLAVLIVYGVAMTPKTTVTMENVYTGQTRTIANVPLGIAFAGNLFSQIGVTLTETFETIYSYPGLTDDGYVSALRSWEIVRRSANNPSSYAAANTVGGGDFARSWINYVSSCTAPGLDLGALRMATIETTPFVHDALRHENRALGAAIYTTAGFTDPDCVAAHDALLSYSRTQFIPALKRDVLAHLLHDPNRTTSAPSVATVDTRLGDMFAVFTAGPGGMIGPGLDVDEALLSLYVGALVQHGALRRLQLDRQNAYAIMVGDAIRARNAQWTAQGDVFNTYVLPLLSFIEGFFYAMSPLMFVAAMIGFGGFRILSRYAMIGLWIQLWAPTLAVVQLFTYHIISGEFGNLGGTSLTLTSLGGQFTADDVVQKWLATAGLFASSAPALSLLLLSGSIYTFNALAGKIGGPDTINERVAAPERLGTAAAFQPLPTFDYDPRRGAVGHGSAALLPRFRLGSEAAISEQSAERAMAGSRASFVQALDQVYTSANGSELRSYTGEMWRDSASASNSEVYNTVLSDRFSDVTGQMRRAGLSETEIREFTTRAGLAGSLNTRGSDALARAVADLGVNLARRTNTTVSADEATSWARDIARSYGEDETKSGQLMTALASDISGGLQRAGYSATSFAASQSVRREAAQFSEAARAYETARTHSAALGAWRDADVAYLAERVAEGGRPAITDVWRSVAELGLTRQMNDRAREYQNAGHFTSDPAGADRAGIAAALSLMHENGHYPSINRHLQPLGLFVPGVGGSDAHAAVGRGAGAGLGIDLSRAGASAGGPSPESADRRGAVRERFAEERDGARAAFTARAAPAIQAEIAEQRAAAERSLEQREGSTWGAVLSAHTHAGRALGSVSDRVLGTDYVQNWIDRDVSEALSYGVTRPQAEFFAHVRAFPSMATPEQQERHRLLREQVMNEYAGVSNAGEAVVARLSEAAAQTETPRQRLFAEVAAMNRNIQVGEDPSNLGLFGRGARHEP